MHNVIITPRFVAQYTKMEQETQWRIMSTDKYDHKELNSPLCIGSAIWLLQNPINDVENSAIIEYHTNSDTVSPLIPFPNTFKYFDGDIENSPLLYCTLNSDSIVIIDTRDQNCGIIFNTKSRKFSDVFSFQQPSDSWASCFAVGDFIHIHHGADSVFNEFNGNAGEYTIYSTKHKESEEFLVGAGTDPYPCDYALIKSNDCYQSSNKMLISGFSRNLIGSNIPSEMINLISEFSTFEVFRFGGIDANNNCFDSDAFCVGTLNQEDAAKPLNWTLVPEYTMSHAMRDFGYVQYGSFVVTFGGMMGQSDLIEFDEIYVLDLHKKSGWVQSPIKCPEEGTYEAVLDDNLTVHLFGDYSHHCMELIKIVPSL